MILRVAWKVGWMAAKWVGGLDANKVGWMAEKLEILTVGLWVAAMAVSTALRLVDQLVDLMAVLKVSPSVDWWAVAKADRSVGQRAARLVGQRAWMLG